MLHLDVGLLHGARNDEILVHGSVLTFGTDLSNQADLI